MAVGNSGKESRLYGHVVPTLKKIRMVAAPRSLQSENLLVYFRVLIVWGRLYEIECTPICTLEQLLFSVKFILSQ